MSSLKILTLTWNMSGEDTSRSADAWARSAVGAYWSRWLRGMSAGASGEALEHGTNAFDVVALCLQEVHRKSQFDDFFLAELNRSLPKAGKTPAQVNEQKFISTVAKNKSLARLAGHSFDQHLYLFYRANSGFSVAKRGSTCFGAGGSCVKGSVAMHLHRGGEHYIFVCSHFPLASVGLEGDIARNAAYRSTLEKLIAQMRTLHGTVLDSSDVTVVWGGDFNYRSERIPLQFNDTIPPNEKQGDRYNDRLAALRAEGRPEPWPYNAGWRECTETTLDRRFKPNYQPTCRLVQLPRSAGSEEIVRQGRLRHEGLKAAYTLVTRDGSARNPSWCDRIFIKPLDVRQLTCKSNKFSTGSVESDHDAVFAELTLALSAVGVSLVQGEIEEWHDFMDPAALGQLCDRGEIGCNPPRAPNTIAEWIGSSWQFDTLADSLRKTELDTVLSEPGPFTLFAPDDRAWTAMPDGTIGPLMRDTKLLKATLLEHVVPGEYCQMKILQKSPLTSVGGTELRIAQDDEGNLRVNGALIKESIRMQNGYIHVIGQLLLSGAASVEARAIGVQSSDETDNVMTSLLRQWRANVLSAGSNNATTLAGMKKVFEALNAAQPLTEDSVLVDLGSGAGMPAIYAALRYGTRSYGIELDPQLVAVANDYAQQAGVSALVTFTAKNLLELDANWLRTRKASHIYSYDAVFLPNIWNAMIDALAELPLVGASTTRFQTNWPDSFELVAKVPDVKLAGSSSAFQFGIWRNQPGSSTSVDANIRSVNWKQVLEGHADLSMQRAWAIGKGNAETLLAVQTRLTANTADWRLFRSSASVDLQGKVRALNTAVRDAAQALLGQNSVKLNNAKQAASIAASQLAAFFEKHKPRRSRAQSNDYQQAFSAYASCLIDHAVAVDRVLRAKSSADVSAAMQKKQMAETKCLELARAAAEVLDGGRRLASDAIEEEEPVGSLLSRTQTIAAVISRSIVLRDFERAVSANHQELWQQLGKKGKYASSKLEYTVLVPQFGALEEGGVPLNQLSSTQPARIANARSQLNNHVIVGKRLLLKQISQPLEAKTMSGQTIVFVRGEDGAIVLRNKAGKKLASLTKTDTIANPIPARNGLVYTITKALPRSLN